MNAVVDLAKKPHEELTLAERIAHFAADFSLDQVPEDVIDYACLCVADTIGIGFASHNYDFASRSVNAVSGLATAGDFPVVGTSLKLPVRDAALLNGLLMHGLDFDDTHTGAVIHASTSAVPLMLAEALRHQRSGKDALAAYLLAIETDARIGLPARGMLQKTGFHPTGLVGIFGCTVAASYLGGLTAAATAGAQGIALSMAGGSLEFLEDGAWTKRLHPGWAASSAIMAATLAGGEFAAPKRAYEGRYGFYALYLPDLDIDAAEIGYDLGTTWEMRKIAIKPYPVCHFNHASIDAILDVVTEHDLRPDDIVKVTALIHEKQQDVVCLPEAAKRRPQSDYEGKFSIHFALAAAIVRRRFTLAELDNDALFDQAILDVCDRVTFRHDPDSRYPEFFSGGVIVETKDGRTLEARQPVNRGAEGRELDADAVYEKFVANVSTQLDAAATEKLWDTIIALPHATDVAALNEALLKR